MNFVIISLYGIYSAALLVILFFVLYYFFFAIIYLVKREKISQSLQAETYFLILIPAHNEEKTLTQTLRSVSYLNYPKNFIKVVVVADNCSDGTANIARQLGVTCIERKDQNEVGKGYALKWGIQHLANDKYDVLVIIDADTQMDHEFLIWMNNEFLSGARMAQGFNHIANPQQTSLTRLMEVTSYLKNLFYYAGKSKIGLSSALMGTGMAFHREIIQHYGWNAFSVGEDWEQTGLLALEGIPVIFAEKAKTYAEEAVSFRQGYSQRMRWAGGKFQVAWRYGPKLILEGIQKRSMLTVDVGLMIVAPNYSLLANLTILLICCGFFLPDKEIKPYFQIMAAGLLAAQIFYFLLGLLMMRPNKQTVFSIAMAPLFLFWKLYIDIASLFKVKKMKWVRTRRS